MEQFKEYFNLRSTIYKILAYGFYMEPDAAYLQDLERCAPLFSTCHRYFPVPALEEGVEHLDRFLTSACANVAQGIQEHERYFARIFLSTGFSKGMKSVVPHESVYLSKSGWSMQDQRDEVLACYHAEGVGKTVNFKEPEDHISAELNFISLLSRRTSDAISANDEQLVHAKLQTQLNFIARHPAEWIDRMCEDLFHISESDLYKALARLTAGFISADVMFLRGVLEKKET